MKNDIKSCLMLLKMSIENELNKQTAISFKNLNQFPTGSGVYFIYNEQNELIYIGAGMSIIDRCSQYIRPGDHGGTLRLNMIQKDLYPNEKIKKIKTMKSENDQYATIIETTCTARFIPVVGTEDDVAYEEAVYIAAFKPKYNKFKL